MTRGLRGRALILREAVRLLLPVRRRVVGVRRPVHRGARAPHHNLHMCVRSSAQTWNVQHGYYAVTAFTHLFEIAGSGTVDNKSLMCCISSYPEWLAPECTGCMYGSSNGIACQCYIDSCGQSCDNVCPGGVSDVCSGHGECQPTGMC